MKGYTVQRTVIEYYAVKANSKKEALAADLENPYEIEVQSKRAFLDFPIVAKQEDGE